MTFSSCWDSTSSFTDDLTKRCNITRSIIMTTSKQFKYKNTLANKIQKAVKDVVADCGEIFRDCKDREDEAVAYVARYTQQMLNVDL